MKTTHDLYTGGTYSAAHPSYHVEDSAWKANEIDKICWWSQHLQFVSSMVEVGCGAGEILRQMQTRMDTPTCFYHGFDINPLAIWLAQARENAKLKFFAGDFLESPLNYDMLLCMDVFEHVEDYIGFLRGLSKRAKYFVFHIPLDLSAQTVARGGKLNYKRSERGHLHYFSKETAISTLEHAGFRILRHSYTGSGVDKSYGGLSSLMRWPRRLLFKFAPDLTVRVLGGYSLMVLAVPQKEAV